MYLSCLLINTGNDPDRERPARNWLRNLYRVHQRLSMAFPSGESKSVDPCFLQPYDPGNFTQTLNNKEQRSTVRGFLFRVEPRPTGQALILVQSAIVPDWDYAFQNTGFLSARRSCAHSTPNSDRAPKSAFAFSRTPPRRWILPQNQNGPTPTAPNP